MPYIKILITPPGEAPLNVRRAWVGLVLPFAEGRYAQATKLGTWGVLSGPKSYFGRLVAILLRRYKMEYGYAVEAITAVEILESTNPQAAQWWRENAPHVLQPGRRFMFAAGVCQLHSDGT